jgi:hypothetical protein
MMRRTIAALSLSLLIGGCAADGSLDSEPDVVDEGQKEDGVTRPAGVFERREATGSQLAELMLLGDHTFIRRGADDEYRTRGRYQFTRSSTTTYIRFFDTDGTLIDRYAYRVNGSVVRLRLDSSAASYAVFSEAHGEAAWVEAVKSDWFDEAFDIEPSAFPRVAVYPSDLPAAARATYDELIRKMPPSSHADLFRFDLHGSRGYELRTDGRVQLFDGAGAVVATGTGDTMFNFSWDK